MAETNGSLQQTRQPNPALESLFAALDPISLILSKQNSNSEKINTLQQLATTESFIMERGPRYRAYAELRESRLRMKSMRNYEEPESRILTPPRKQVKFQGTFPAVRKVSSSSSLSSSSVLAQSVPDFSSVLRKENRKPATRLPPTLEMTPPSKSATRFEGIMSKLGGSKSANAGEKRGGGLMARKSYASMEELKIFSSGAANAIVGENRGGGGRNGRGNSSSSSSSKTVLGYRQF